MTTIQLKDLHPNPFRDLKRLPTKPEKVAVLKESIKETSFWDNIVCRKAPNGSGGYEIAYGHNRLEALRQLNRDGRYDEVNIPVRNFDNSMMAKIMARENHEEWGSSAEIDSETARAIIAAFGAGEIELQAPPKMATAVREAIRSGAGSRPYTAETLAVFLGWHLTKTKTILQLLDFQTGEVGRHIDFTGLGSEQVRKVIAATNRVERETNDKKAAADIGKTLAAELREASSLKLKSDSTKRKVSKRTLGARADELMREARVTRRRAERQVKADKLNLQKEDRQVKQFLDACKVFGAAMQAAGKATSKFSPEAKRFTLRRLTEIANEIGLLKGRLG